MPYPKKNQTFTFIVNLDDSAVLGQFKVNPTIAVGDFKVSTDDSALTNLTNLPTVSPAGSCHIKIILTAAEMNGDRVVVEIKDQTSPSEWEPLVIKIYPEVNAFVDIAAKTGLLQFDGSNNVKSVQQYPTGAVVADAGNTSGSFKTNLAGATDDYWKDVWVQFTSGALAGQAKRVFSFNATTKFLTFTSAFTATPAATDTFKIINE